MKRINLLLFVLLSCSFSVAHSVGNESAINISLIHDGSKLWNAFFQKEKSNFNISMQKKFSDVGFSRVNIKNCHMDSNKRVECDSSFSDNSLMHLRILLVKIQQGKRKKGLSFTLEMSNQRAPVKKTVDVIPVTCRLSAGNPDKLIGLSRAEQQVKEKYFSKSDSARYVSDRVFSACDPLLEEQTRLALKENDSKKVYSPFPDVYIEKVTVHDEGAAVELSDTDEDEQDKSTLAQKSSDYTSVQVEKKSGKKTQYIIHNKGDTITVELGRGQQR